MVDNWTVVLGGTGFLGSVFVRRLVAEGRTVGVQGRDPGRVAELCASVAGGPGVAVPLVCRLASDEDVVALQALIRAQPMPLVAAVATLGGWYVGADLAETTVESWHDTIAGNLTAHFVAARAIAPLLGGPAPTYVAMNGIAGLKACVGSGAISVSGVGEKMILDVMRGEQIGQRVHFRDLFVLADIVDVVAPGPGSISASAVTDLLMRVLDGSVPGPTVVMTEDGTESRP